MNLIFPLLGVIASWVGLIHFGPPRIYGEWNIVSVVLWFVFTGFFIRLVAAFFGLVPSSGGRDHDA